MNIRVGDIITVNYTTFEGKTAIGLFIVVYHEGYDKRSSDNITCVKISSHRYSYSVELDPVFVPCLDHLSYANCNQQFRFIEPQVIRVLGYVNSYILLSLRNQLYGYAKNIIRQLESRYTYMCPKATITHLGD